MAAIDQYLRQILVATYGEDVRRSIHDAIKQNNTDVLDSVEKANAAVDAAENAAENAEQALNKANAAVDAAENAYEAAMDVSKLATIVNSSSGAIASFSDGADAPIKGLSVGIEPVQDLHGYDHPWPEGGEKNLADFVDNKNIDESGVVINSTGRIATVNPITIKDGVTYIAKAFGTATGIIIAVWNGNTMVRRVLQSFDTPLNTDGGDRFYICVYHDNAVTVESAKAMVIKSTETVTAYSPYSNICPITGWTGAKVSRTGKNLIKTVGITYAKPDNVSNSKSSKRKFSQDTYCYGISADNYYDEQAISEITVDDGVISFTANLGGYGVGIPIVGLKPENTYTISGVTENANFRIAVYTKDGTFIELFSNNTFTLPSNAVYTLIVIRGITNNTPSRVYNIQLELGSTATDYEPYQGQTYDIAFPSEAGTVYGGELTVNEDGTGTLTVTKILITLDGTNNKINGKWDETAYGSACYSTYLGERNYYRNSISNIFKYASNDYERMPLYSFVGSSGSSTTVTFIFPTGYTVADANAWLAEMSANGTPVVITMALATTITYTLTAEQVHTLLGYNNIWADTGNVEVTYPADTKLYIDGKIAEAIANALNA